MISLTHGAVRSFDYVSVCVFSAVQFSNLEACPEEDRFSKVDEELESLSKDARPSNKKLKYQPHFSTVKYYQLMLGK